MTERYGLILFPETREAMTAEKEGRAHGLSVRIVPTPGKLVASCGFSLRYDLTGEDELYQFLQHLSVRTDGWYPASRQGLRTDYERGK